MISTTIFGFGLAHVVLGTIDLIHTVVSYSKIWTERKTWLNQVFE